MGTAMGTVHLPRNSAHDAPNPLHRNDFREPLRSRPEAIPREMGTGMGTVARGTGRRVHRTPVQRNDFRVGRRGLEPLTYGLKAFPITPQTTGYQAIATDSGPPGLSQNHPGPS